MMDLIIPHRRMSVKRGLCVLFILGVALRVPHLGIQPLWTDEANCLAIAQGASGPVWEALQHDCSPPLYYWLLGLSVGPDRPSETKTRGLSALLGILSIPLLGWVGWSLLGNAGLLAGVFLAVSPLHVWHSQEARMYSLIVFLGIMLAFLTSRTRQQPRSRYLVALIVVQLALLWTHHFSIFAVASSWILLLFGRGRIPLVTARPYILVLLFGWLPVVWLAAVQSFAFDTGSWLPPPPPDAVARTIGLWLTGVQARAHSIIHGVPISPVFAGIGAVLLVVRGLGSRVGREQALLSGVGLVLAFLVSLGRPAYTPGRYDVSLLPAFFLLLAAGWKRSGVAMRSVALVCLLLPSLLGIRYYYSSYKKGAIREMVHLIEEEEQPGDVVVIAPEIEAPVFHYYYSGKCSLLVPPSFGDVFTVDYFDYRHRWGDKASASVLAEMTWMRVPPGGRMFLLYSPYKSTVQYKGWLQKKARESRKIRRRVSGSGSTELSLLERDTPSVPRTGKTHPPAPHG